MLRRLMGRGRSRVSVRMTLEPSDAVPLEAALAMTRFPDSTSAARTANVILTDTRAPRPRPQAASPRLNRV